MVFYIFLFVLSFLPLTDLFHPGLFKGHDTLLHVARASSFFQSLSEGNLIPRWGGNLNLGYGHPSLMFYYPAPSYLAALLHVVGFSFVDCIKIIFGLGYMTSIFAMYIWSKEAWGNRAGFIAAILYGFAPYRFVDLYIRGALGEHLTFLLMPLILLGLLKHARDSSFRWLCFTGLFVGVLILTHNVVSIMFLPILALYALYLWFFEANRRKSFAIGLFFSLVVVTTQS